jgi:hypothetical protein
MTLLLFIQKHVLRDKPTSPADSPNWNYDCPSCSQAPTQDSEGIIKLIANFSDPFRCDDKILVLTKLMSGKIKLKLAHYISWDQTHNTS